jgi:hypothetical protein
VPGIATAPTQGPALMAPARPTPPPPTAPAHSAGLFGGRRRQLEAEHSHLTAEKCSAECRE